jgi:hypothetical protein
MKLDELRKFLVDANTNGYASASAAARKEADGSTSISYVSGDWKMHDNYFGGEPFGGREIVFYKNQPFWIMVYYGRVAQGFNPKEVFQFLKEALLSMPQEAPYRGNKYLSRDDFEYFNEYTGKVDDFEGREKITFKGVACYEARYFGGLVDVKK